MAHFIHGITFTNFEAKIQVKFPQSLSTKANKMFGNCPLKTLHLYFVYMCVQSQSIILKNRQTLIGRQRHIRWDLELKFSPLESHHK